MVASREKACRILQYRLGLPRAVVRHTVEQRVTVVHAT